MDNKWSQYVQTSEELYRSRAMRFHDGNKDLWLKALQIENGMNILEVGCGGGIFCHRIKSYLPTTNVTGLDFDIGHIQYAKTKSKELDIDCAFVNGDAVALPFADDTFDLCFSHTVMNFCEPNAFIKEQYRVLKSNGKIHILVASRRVNSEIWKPTNSAEKALFEKLWNEADKNDLSVVSRHELTESEHLAYLFKNGFNDVSVNIISVVSYAPDSSTISEETAIEQINVNRLHELSSIEKAQRLAPSALTTKEYEELIALINKRYDIRIDQYMHGEKLWDIATSTVLIYSGRK